MKKKRSLNLFPSEMAIEDLDPGALNSVAVAVRTESGVE